MRLAPKPQDSRTTKNASVFYALSMLASFFNFLYYPVISHLVPPGAFGEIQFLVSILFQISVIFLGLNVITIILSVRHGKSTLASRKVAALAALFNRTASLLVVPLTIALVATGTSYFHFNSFWPFIALAAAILSTIPFTINIGKLQGQGSFAKSGYLNSGGSLLKLIVSTILVLCGLGTTGALLGIAIGQFVATVIGLRSENIPLRDVFNVSHTSYGILREERRLIVTAGLCIIAANLLSILDVTYAKLSLSPHDAGLYAGISALAKISIYVVSPLMWLVIPLATNLRANKTKVRTLGALVGALCTGLLLFYLLFGQWFAGFILGGAYANQQPLLLHATLAMSILAIATFQNTILAASARYKSLIMQTILMVGTVALFIAITSQQQSIQSMLNALLAGGLAGIVYYITVTQLFANSRDDTI